MTRLGCVWRYAYERPVLTTEGFQAKLLVTTIGDPPTARPRMTVLSRPCPQSCEAKESVLLHTLLWLNNVKACRIGDLHYTELILRENP
jgi:hypothetical protein